MLQWTDRGNTARLASAQTNEPWFKNRLVQLMLVLAFDAQLLGKLLRQKPEESTCRDIVDSKGISCLSESLGTPESLMVRCTSSAKELCQARGLIGPNVKLTGREGDGVT